MALASFAHQPIDMCEQLLCAAKLKNTLRRLLLWARYSRAGHGVVAMPHINEERSEDHMLAYLTAEGRLLGCTRGDWALLLGGFALVGFVTLLTA